MKLKAPNVLVIMAPLALLLGVHGENAFLIGVVSVSRLDYGIWFE